MYLFSVIYKLDQVNLRKIICIPTLCTEATLNIKANYGFPEQRRQSDQKFLLIALGDASVQNFCLSLEQCLVSVKQGMNSDLFFGLWRNWKENVQRCGVL